MKLDFPRNKKIIINRNQHENNEGMKLNNFYKKKLKRGAGILFKKKSR